MSTLIMIMYTGISPHPRSEGIPQHLTPPRPIVSPRTVGSAFCTWSSHFTSYFRFLVLQADQE